MDRQNAIQQPTEILLQEIDLENKIREALEETQIYFDYNVVPNNIEGETPLIKLDLITINKEHNQKFLFHSLKGQTKIDILQSMIEYITQYKEKLQTYEIEWLDSKQGNDKIQQSWFRGNDIFDVLHKFYYEKEKSRFRIFKVKLMPEA